MSLEHILLGYLRQPATGYDLGKEFEDAARHFWFAEKSQIYPTLRRLEQKGWLSCREEPSERGPARKVYEITPAGREELRGWLLGGPQIGRERLGYIAQTFFLDELQGPEQAAVVVEQMLDRWRQTLAFFELGEKQALDQVGDWPQQDDATFFQLASLRMGIKQMQAKIAWCEETLERLSGRAGNADERFVGARQGDD